MKGIVKFYKDGEVVGNRLCFGRDMLRLVKTAFIYIPRIDYMTIEVPRQQGNTESGIYMFKHYDIKRIVESAIEDGFWEQFMFS